MKKNKIIKKIWKEVELKEIAKVIIGKPVELGDIKIATAGYVGTRKEYVRKGYLQEKQREAIACVRAKKKYIQKYLWYSILSKKFEKYAKKISTGTTIQHINKSQIESYKIQLPPPSERKYIVDTLDLLENKIELLERQKETLKTLAETLFTKCFIKERNNKWNFAKLGNLASIYYGFSFRSCDFVKDKDREYRVIKNRNIQDGYLNIEKCSFLREVPKKMKDYCFLEAGDILLSLVGNKQRCCFVYYQNLLLGQKIAKIRSKFEWLSKEFLFFLLKSDEFQNHCYGWRNGSTVIFLNKNAFPSFRFLLPPKTEIKKFTKHVSPLLQKIHKNRQQVQKIKQLRDQILPRMTSGNALVLRSKNQSISCNKI